MDLSLASIFLAALPQVAASTNAGALQQVLAEILAAARERYPELTVSDEAYVVHLARRVDPSVPVVEELALRRRTEDLLLACACAEGDRAAIARLESECIRSAQKYLGKRGIAGDVVEEANQNVRERLLVGDGTPKILEYDGKGELRTWVRVVVVREAISLAKKGQNEVPLSYDLLEAPDLRDTPEAAYFKSRYRTAYKAAFEAAVEALTPRQRALLRQQVVLGMNVDEIAVVYQVHRATAARWAQAARDELVSKVRQELAVRLNVSRDELESIVRMIESQLTVSMGRLLRATKA